MTASQRQFCIDSVTAVSSVLTALQSLHCQCDDSIVRPTLQQVTTTLAMTLTSKHAVTPDMK